MKIDYTIKYSERRTYGLYVERDKSVLVHAPLNKSKEDIEQFIEKKRFWIYTKLKHAQKYQKTIKKEFVSGSSILYLGRNYKLDITNDESNAIKFEDSRIVLSNKHKDDALKIFKNWYLQKASEKIIPRVEYYANNLGVSFNKVLISELRYRWGSCTPKNNLNFNWKLIKAPINVIDYVIIHELAHLLENNHTPKFWNIVKIQHSDFQTAKEWLKENGNLLEIDF